MLRWFDAHRRDLPWRRQPSPYRTLVSEFMLQQTVVATVEPYFERFVARFPDFAALAAAREDEVTALWSGLGYYARARNLRRAAIAVVADHGGVLPGDEETLRALPGIGPYTAAAVAAIAFDRRTFALDGNGIRVLARLLRGARAGQLPATREELRALGQSLVPAARAGDFNQAMMELGALGLRAPGRRTAPPVRVRAHCATVRLGSRPRTCPSSSRAPRAARWRSPARWSSARAACCWCAGSRASCWRAPGRCPSADIAAGVRGRGRRARRRDRPGRGRDGAAGIRGARAARLHPSRPHRGGVLGSRRARGVGATPERRWVARDELADLGVSSFTRKTLAIGRSSEEKRRE